MTKISFYKLVVPAAQREWLDQLRDDIVVVGENKVLKGFIDTGSDFSSLPRTALEQPAKWIGSVASHTYNSWVTCKSTIQDFFLLKFQF